MLQLLAMIIARFVPGVDGYKTIIGLLLTGGVAAVEQGFGVDLPNWLSLLGMSIAGVGATHKVVKAQSLAAMEALPIAALPGGFLGRFKEWSTWAALISLAAIFFGGDAQTWQDTFKQVFDSAELLAGAVASAIALFEPHPDTPQRPAVA